MGTGFAGVGCRTIDTMGTREHGCPGTTTRLGMRVARHGTIGTIGTVRAGGHGTIRHGIVERMAKRQHTMVTGSTHEDLGERVKRAIAALDAMHALFDYVNDMSTHGCTNAQHLVFEICNTFTTTVVPHRAEVQTMAQQVENAPVHVRALANDMTAYFAQYGLDGTLCAAFAYYVTDRATNMDLHAQRLLHKLGRLFK